MASRLSEESLRAVLDAGQQGLVIESEPASLAVPGDRVDLDALLVAEDPEKAVQAVAPQSMYAALVAKGPEDCLDVLPLLSEEQVTRIFDYDVWDKDRLEPLKAVRWLSLFKEVGPEEMLRRFRDLDEEYQVGLLAPLVELFTDEEYEKMSQGEQDALHRLPCGTLFYRLKSADSRLDEFVEGLVEAALASDVAYAYSLLAHASYMPPNEQEALLGQFRRARLEEDGFVSYEESLAAFRPVDLEQLRQRWAFALHRETAALAPAPEDDARPFLRRVVEDEPGAWTPDETETRQRGLAFLGNSLCAAAQIAPDDVGGMARVLTHAQSLLSLGLEWLASGDPRTGREILKKEHPQLLFRAGLTLVWRLADAVLQAFVRHGLPEAATMRQHLALDKRGLLELDVERLTPLLGFERVELLKGLLTRFPVRPAAVGEDEEGALRVTFRPIASVAELRDVATLLDALTGLLHVASLADDDRDAATVPLDVRLMRALARVQLGGGPFRSAPLSEAEAAAFVDLPAPADALVNDLFAGIEGSLRVALDGPPADGWSASRAAGLHVDDPVAPVMTELADLVQRLQVAREHARTTGVPLTELIQSPRGDA